MNIVHLTGFTSITTEGVEGIALQYKPDVPKEVGVYCQQPQDHGLELALDNELIAKARSADRLSGSNEQTIAS